MATETKDERIVRETKRRCLIAKADLADHQAMELMEESVRLERECGRLRAEADAMREQVKRYNHA